jgi:hypothetical protein
MAETSWGAEPEAPRKRGIPGWVWFCGAGCLLALIVAVVGGVFAFRGIKKAVDPEAQWAAIDEVLPYDERPEGWAPQVGFGSSLLGFETFVLIQTGGGPAGGAGPGGLVAVLMVVGGAQGEDLRRQMLDPRHGELPFGLGGRTDAKRSTVEVQGRSLDLLRATQLGGQHGGGATAIVDLTEEGSKRALVLQLLRPASPEPIGDGEIAAFLEPFEVPGGRR